jgi:beta-glucosidase
MTDEERFSLISSLMVHVFRPGGGSFKRDPRIPPDVPNVAGWVPGIPRLGVPALLITDAGLGVTNPMNLRPGDTATALPAGLALGATFNPSLARAAGTVVGREAKTKGFNVLCGGGMNIVRDPRHGRNFEYISEDPWLSAVMTAESVIGNQSQGIISMFKHFCLNSHEINKFWLNAVIDPAAFRESDLLAFQIAIELAEPGSIMGAYNKVNGEYCCGNAHLLNDTLKGVFGFKGFIMSDWHAVYDWRFANYGLDQHSGAQLDEQEWFREPLKKALAHGEFSHERLSDMVRRILRSIYAVGADKPASDQKVDLNLHNSIALEVARQGIVLLQNDGILPLSADARSVAVIGGHADRGVLAGGGSSQGTPPEGIAFKVPLGGESPLASIRNEAYFPSSPFHALKVLLPKAAITFDPGMYPADAAALARHADIAVVFATKFECEGFDSPNLDLPFGQDEVISAVAAVNPNTVVVLETGNPIAMPWRNKVQAIVQTWYPGQAGGQAIAEILTGIINPSGRLPITFPVTVADTPRPACQDLATQTARLYKSFTLKARRSATDGSTKPAQNRCSRLAMDSATPL